MSVCEAPSARVKSYTRVVNTQSALKILSCVYELQRSLRDWAVDHLTRLMLDGKFLSGTSIDVAICDGKSYLVDGQHRLHAVVKAGIEMEFVIIERYVNNMDDISRWYSVIDHNLKRSHADSACAFGIEGKYSLSQMQINRLSPAISFLVGDFKRMDKEDKLLDEEIFGKYPKYINAYHAFNDAIRGCSGDTRVKMHRQPILSVALITFLHRPEQAEPFWRDVALDNGLFKGDPAKALNMFIQRGCKGGQQSANCTSNEYIARCVASAWNAYYQNKKLEYIRPKSGHVPVMISGTPYTGGV